MDQLHRVTVLNNMGAHLLDVHNIEGAIQAFQEAIHVLKCSGTTPTLTPTLTPTTASVTMDTNGSGPTIDHHNRYMTWLQESLLCIPSIFIHPARLSTHTIQASTERAFGAGGNHNNNKSHNNCCTHTKTNNHNTNINSTYEYHIHDQALILPTITGTLQRHSKRTAAAAATTFVDARVATQMRTASIVILFNLCISCHQLGKGSGQSAMVIQALRVHELVVQMIFQQLTPTTTTTSGGTFLRVVLCLTLNNMVSIHYDDFCDFDNGMICIEYIQKLLLRHSAAMDTIAVKFMAPREWSDIKLNALVIQSPSAAQAA